MHRGIEYSSERRPLYHITGSIEPPQFSSPTSSPSRLYSRISHAPPHENPLPVPAHPYPHSPLDTNTRNASGLPNQLHPVVYPFNSSISYLRYTSLRSVTCSDRRKKKLLDFFSPLLPLQRNTPSFNCRNLWHSAIGPLVVPSGVVIAWAQRPLMRSPEVTYDVLEERGSARKEF